MCWFFHIYESKWIIMNYRPVIKGKSVSGLSLVASIFHWLPWTAPPVAFSARLRAPHHWAVVLVMPQHSAGSYCGSVVHAWWSVNIWRKQFAAPVILIHWLICPAPHSMPRTFESSHEHQAWSSTSTVKDPRYTTAIWARDWPLSSVQPWHSQMNQKSTKPWRFISLSLSNQLATEVL